MSPPAIAPVPDAATEEVRVAMALNGGVSLAVWMGGCAVELDCARRAHRGGEEPMGDGEHAPPPRRVYAALCQAFDRELVVDIMSGSSAGGINGALLGAVMVTGRRLHPDVIRGRWLELGDFSRLLQPLSVARPPDLMNGAAFHTDLLATFRTVLGEGVDPANDLGLVPGGPHPVAIPALDVTTTDIGGDARTFRDEWDLELHASEFRAAFRFRRAEDFTAEQLAAAARSSASFPIAFAPFRLEHEGALALAGLKGPRWVVDGGLLDNAPIRAALALIPDRPATRQVRRFLCYVNPDPTGPDLPRDATPPTLEQVIGTVVNLPRKAPFVVQLEAVQQAARRSGVAAAAELDLLALDLGALQATATALLPVYRRRRRLQTLQALMTEPSDAMLVFNRLGDQLELPWVPTTIVPPPPGAWGWGRQAAKRVHHLVLDLIRQALRTATPDAREELLQTRVRIDGRLAGLDAFPARLAMRGVLDQMREQEDVVAEVAALGALMTDMDPGLRADVVATAHDAFAASVQLGAIGGVPVGVGLFGADWVDADAMTEAMEDHFIARALAVEVVRRAFVVTDDVDDGQPLAFVQLTPYAPDLLLNSEPVTRVRAASPKLKLTGTELAHFGGFYRRSWRVNDFLWGRMDAAARIAVLLVDDERSGQMAAERGFDVAGRLVASLLPGDATDVELWLVREALDDAGVPAQDDQRARLVSALQTDLYQGDGSLTRVVAVRAAQLEVLCHELPVLIDEVAGDGRLGSSRATLGLPTADAIRDGSGVRDAVMALRADPALRTRLGCADGSPELTSDLAVRTVARTGLVGLGLLRGSGLPVARPAQGMRAFLLPLAGAVSRSPLSRAAVVVAFWAAALFLAARMVSLPADPGADLRELTLLELVATVLALLVVAGTAGVPIFRARRKGRERARQWLWAGGFVVAGALATLVLGIWRGDFSFAELAVADGADQPPRWVLYGPLAVILGTSIIRLPLVGKLVADRLETVVRGRLSGVIALASAGAVGGWALGPILDHAGDGDWRAVVAWIALAVAPLIAVGYLFVRPAIVRRG